MKLKQLLLTSICCLLAFSSNATATEAENHKEYYNLHDEATCKNNYCVDTENNPITGVIRRYRDGFLVREYITKDGYLEGTSHAYYNNGKIKSERSYKQGKLNGNAIEYNEDGEMVENIAYKEGKKEGIASYYDEKNITKIVYINDIMNGDVQIWDRNNNKLIYKLKMQNNTIKQGTYTYQKEQDTEETELTQLIIDGTNNQCLELQDTFSSSSCMINITPAISILSNSENFPQECNKEWYNQNRRELAEYIKICKCNNLKNEIKEVYEDQTQEKNQRREQLLALKEKYENHCLKKAE